MYVIYRFVYIYKFIFYRFTIYLYKITYIFVKFGNFWVAILIKFGHFWVVILRKRQYLSCNFKKTAIFEFQFQQKSGILIYNSSKSREFFFLEYLWRREYDGIRSLRVKRRKSLIFVAPEDGKGRGWNRWNIDGGVVKRRFELSTSALVSTSGQEFRRFRVPRFLSQAQPAESVVRRVTLTGSTTFSDYLRVTLSLKLPADLQFPGREITGGGR